MGDLHRGGRAEVGEAKGGNPGKVRIQEGFLDESCGGSWEM